MLLERSEIMVREGQEEAFAEALATRGAPLLRSVPGVRSVAWGRGVESPGKFILLVEWDTMESHTAFTTTDAFGELRTLMLPHSTGGGMEHFEMR